ncbi:MAG: HEAT repeat domain-containing protein [Armatimonadetes bacterium]|nr:HEAT repeat domain-containing protein [Armatimonadota bacterium]
MDPEVRRQITWVVIITLIASLVVYASHRRHELDILRDTIATGHPAERLAAVKLLVAKEKLPDALENQPRWVQDHVVECIARIGTPQALFQLTASVRHLDDPVASRAQKVLARFGTIAVGPLIKALKDKDAAVRGAAVNPLAEIGEPAIPSLLELVDAWDQYVRDGVVQIFGKIGAPVTGPLIEIIQRTEPLPDQTPQRFLWARDTAVRSLVQMKIPAIQPIIDHLLGFPDAEVRAIAADTLGKIADQTVSSPIAPEEAQRVVRPLVDRLNNDPAWTVRRKAATALGGLADVAKQMGVVDVLIAHLSDPRPEVKAAAAEALGRIGDPKAAQPLVATLVHNRFGAVREIEVALEKLGAPALPFIVPALNHPEAEVRRAGVEALAKIGTPDAVVPLAQRLKDPDIAIRRRAADALITLADARVVPQLIEALRDPDPHVYYPARDALANVGGPAVPALIAALADPQPRVAHMAEQALARVGKSAVAKLCEALASPDGRLRQWAAIALGDIGPDATKALTAYLADRSKPAYARAAAADALGRTGSPDALEPLVAAATREQPEVQKAALRALVRLGDEKATPALVAALTAPDQGVRQMAMLLLMQWHLGDVRKLLRELIRSEDINAKRRAAIAYSFITSAAAAHELLAGWEVVAAEEPAGLQPISVETILAEAVRDPGEQPDVRLWAVRALGYVGTDKAVTVLADLLRPGETLASEAARAIARIGRRITEEKARAEEMVTVRREPSAAAKRLTDLLLTTTDPQLRLDAAVALSMMAEDPVWGLTDRLADVKDDQRLWIVAVLGAIGKPASDVCVELRGVTDNPVVKEWVTVALALIKDAQAMDLLQHLPRSEQPDPQKVTAGEAILEKIRKARTQTVL